MAAGWKGRRPGTQEPEAEGTTYGSAQYKFGICKYKLDIGEIKFRGEWVEGKHEHIVDIQYHYEYFSRDDPKLDASNYGKTKENLADIMKNMIT